MQRHAAIATLAASLANSWPIFTGLNGGNFYGPLLQLDDISNSAGTSAPSGNSKHTTTARSYTWFFSLAARCHSDPALSYVSPSTFLDIINSEYCKRIQTDRLHAADSERRTNQSSLFQSTPRRPASSVWETFPLHKFMGSSAQKNKYGTMWCKIGCGTPTSSTSSLPQSQIVTTIKKSRISWMIAGLRMTAMIMLEFQASGSASTCASPAALLARTREASEADRRSRSQRASGSRRSLPPLLRRRPLRLGARPHRVVRRVPGSSIWRAAPTLG